MIYPSVKKFTYLSIRETAKALRLPENFVRRSVRLGRVPGFYSGTKYYVNLELFVEKLEHDSKSYTDGTENIFQGE